jgi:hypothetical protein
MFARFRRDPVFVTGAGQPEPSGDALAMRANHLAALDHIGTLVFAEHRRDLPDQRLIDALLEVRSKLAPAQAGTTRIRSAVPVIPGRTS